MYCYIIYYIFINKSPNYIVYFRLTKLRCILHEYCDGEHSINKYIVPLIINHCIPTSKTIVILPLLINILWGTKRHYDGDLTFPLFLTVILW